MPVNVCSTFCQCINFMSQTNLTRNKMAAKLILSLTIIYCYINSSFACLNDLYCNHPDLICRNGVCVSKHPRQFREIGLGDTCNDDRDCYTVNVALECHYAYWDYDYYYGRCRNKCRRGQRLLPNYNQCECRITSDCYWYESCSENYGCAIAWWIWLIVALSGIAIIVSIIYLAVFILRTCCYTSSSSSKPKSSKVKRSSSPRRSRNRSRSNSRTRTRSRSGSPVTRGRPNSMHRSRSRDRLTSSPIYSTPVHHNNKHVSWQKQTLQETIYQKSP